MSAVVRFVTGTDTDVGKTIVTAALTAVLRHQGRSPYVVKPAQTGVSGEEPGDLDTVRRLVGDVDGHEGTRLLAPLAPVTAARLEAVVLPTLGATAAAIVDAATHHDVLVEGAGGVLVPLGTRWNLLDLAAEVAAAGFEVSFVVVARAGLGTLNHAALTVGAIKAQKFGIAGLVIGSWPAQPGQAETENLSDLPGITEVPLIGVLPDGAGRMSESQFTSSAPTWITGRF